MRGTTPVRRRQTPSRTLSSQCASQTHNGRRMPFGSRATFGKLVSMERLSAGDRSSLSGVAYLLFPFIAEKQIVRGVYPPLFKMATPKLRGFPVGWYSLGGAVILT